jgi:hypothetical protein
MQVQEIERAKPLHASLINLSGWWHARKLAREFGIDLQRYASAKKECLENAIRFCSDNRHQFSDYQSQSAMYDSWIEVLSDILSASFQNRNLWLIEGPDWGLPPILHYDA